MQIIKKLVLMALISLLFPVCGNDDDGAVGDVEPVSGTWNFQGDPTDNDSCDLKGNAMGDPDGNFEIENNGDSTFTVTADDGTDPFDCTLDGADFECPDRYSDTIEVSKIIAATVTVEATASGTFSSDTEMSGSQDATITCDGAGCGLIESLLGITFPCSFSQTFTASAV